MYITFDYLCTNCDHFAGTVMVRKELMDEVDCRQCGARMKKLPAGTKTTFRFADKELKK